MLPTVAIPNPLPNPVSCPDTPAPREEPLVKPLRVQPSHLAPTALPRVKNSPSPTNDTPTNSWIEVV